MSVAFMSVLVLVVLTACWRIGKAYPRSRNTRACMLGLFLIVLLVIVPNLCLSFSSHTYWMAAWEHRGRFDTTDVDGRAFTVDVYTKEPLLVVVPPGRRPIVKLVAETPDGWASMKYPTNYRHGIGLVRAAPGGVEVSGGSSSSTCFLLRGTEWTVTRRRIDDAPGGNGWPAGPAPADAVSPSRDTVPPRQ